MTPTDPSPTAGDPVRTDFIDYPTLHVPTTSRRLDRR